MGDRSGVISQVYTLKGLVVANGPLWDSLIVVSMSASHVVGCAFTGSNQRPSLKWYKLPPCFKIARSNKDRCLAVQLDCVKGWVVSGNMHNQELMVSIVKVGYCTQVLGPVLSLHTQVSHLIMKIIFVLFCSFTFILYFFISNFSTMTECLIMKRKGSFNILPIEFKVRYCQQQNMTSL